MYKRKMDPKTKQLIYIYAFLLINLVLFTFILIKASDKIKSIQVKDEFSNIQPRVSVEKVQESVSVNESDSDMNLILNIEVSKDNI